MEGPTAKLSVYLKTDSKGKVRAGGDVFSATGANIHVALSLYNIYDNLMRWVNHFSQLNVTDILENNS